MTRGVAISGMGAISAAGLGIDALWAAARDGRSCVKRLDLGDVRGNRIKIGAPVDWNEPEKYIDEAILRTCDRYAQFALYAANEAITASGLDRAQLHSDRTAVILGTGIGGAGTIDAACKAYYSGLKYDTFTVPRVMPGSAASHVSIVHNITGPSFTVTSACASASQAIGIAAMMIRAGIIDRAVTGGAEACLTPATMRNWEYLRVLSSDDCRPFSVGRSGIVIGEGAGICVLESAESLAARGARPVAWLTGYGTSSDARDMVQPDIDGAARAITAALADAALPPEAVGYINAHGTGTVLNDLNESIAIRRVFGDALDDIPASSSKPIVGHTLGAAGALEFLITACALRDQIVPPLINCRAPDPRCRMTLQIDVPAPHEFEFALSNSFAFGGINAALVVARAN